MNLYSKYIKVFNNEILKYLYNYDTEILYVEDKIRLALTMYVEGVKYAVPFRSNMPHHEGKVFRNKISKYGLDFTKAIPVYDESILEDTDFLLKRVEREYYSHDENYAMINLKFEQYVTKVYYEDKYHTTNHKLLGYAQKFHLLLKTNKFKVYNHKQEEVCIFLNVLEYETLFEILDEFYENIDLFKEDKQYEEEIIEKLCIANKNIIIINVGE